jgi:uncharacterized protein (DUF934 family)
MALVSRGKLVEDPYVDVSATETIPDRGSIIVSLTQWQTHAAALRERADPLGLRLKSSETPETVADDLDAFAVIALEFPAFRDGRAYSYARILREHYGFSGELRAVGDVLMEQLHFMLRVGFDAFELEADDPLAVYERALEDFSVWYQPTGDGRPTAVQLRHR